MIDFVKGNVAYIESDYVVIEAGGIGYQIFVPNPFKLVEGNLAFVYTHQVIRDDAHLLYGFLEKDERDFFRLLLDVSGIGPKAGLAMIASGDLRSVVIAIQTEDMKFLTRLPGIGKKTAARIILDLKDKLMKQGWEGRLNLIQNSQVMDSDLTIPHLRDVIDALMGLGYMEEEARRFAEAAKNKTSEVRSTEEWIKQALQISLKR
ncbi:Holliday junction branch migration protein RuvA [Thermoflavimicrobium daqui]|uniref:Holliday junction branch migration complex subunit RuvA n=1 Tax=Thermoflavimicrobium daqui TaxID=2137476 RepID=A0A364K8K1_9BACL|nr:Holliday junction branch migration protein RuvA [Thermoflavimicrobium daqui]RAL26625.1 Holliday junction branch migration protein RuvA [Thermoflavimicrobium daqui]